MDGITFYGRYFNVITMNTQSQKVSMAEKIGYSLGDCSANLVFQMMMIYQTKFYTDIFGLEGAIAGTVMLVARITDAFVDPTVGLLSDRTKTRFGKYRNVSWCGHVSGNIVHGCFGLRCLSWFSMCWLSIIRALKIKGW